MLTIFLSISLILMIWAILTLLFGLGVLDIYTYDRQINMREALRTPGLLLGGSLEDEIYSILVIMSASSPPDITLIRKAFIEGGLMSAVVVSIISNYLH